MRVAQGNIDGLTAIKFDSLEKRVKNTDSNTDTSLAPLKKPWP